MVRTELKWRDTKTVLHFRKSLWKYHKAFQDRGLSIPACLYTLNTSQILTGGKIHMSMLQTGWNQSEIKKTSAHFPSSALFKDTHRDVHLCVYRRYPPGCLLHIWDIYLSSLSLTRFGLQQVPNPCVNIVSRIVWTRRFDLHLYLDAAHIASQCRSAGLW